MHNILTFIIPVRHPENAKDWGLLRKNLSATALSISKQTIEGWKAIIVANKVADIPMLPSGFEIERVQFPPNKMYEQGTNDKEDYYDAVRLDKGKRILAGLLRGGNIGHAMVVDDDDFISRHLTSFVAQHSGANGWFVRDGYIWSGGNLLYKYGDFSRYCGTSHIIRSDLYRLPSRFEDASDGYIRRTLGSHIFIHDDLNATGTPLAPLPFTGAVYRTGHMGAHSNSDDILHHFFWQKDVLSNPLRLAKRLTRLRWKTQTVCQDFFGGD